MANRSVHGAAFEYQEAENATDHSVMEFTLNEIPCPPVGCQFAYTRRIVTRGGEGGEDHVEKNSGTWSNEKHILLIKPCYDLTFA